MFFFSFPLLFLSLIVNQKLTIYCCYYAAFFLFLFLPTFMFQQFGFFFFTQKRDYPEKKKRLLLLLNWVTKGPYLKIWNLFLWKNLFWEIFPWKNKKTYPYTKGVSLRKAGLQWDEISLYPKKALPRKDTG